MRDRVTFIPNKGIDIGEYFKDVVGVTLPDNHTEPEEILLRFDSARQANALLTGYNQ